MARSDAAPQCAPAASASGAEGHIAQRPAASLGEEILDLHERTDGDSGRPGRVGATEFRFISAAAESFQLETVRCVEQHERRTHRVATPADAAFGARENRDLRSKLGRTPFPLAKEREKQPGQVTRLLCRLHAHGLIAKVPRSRRWRVSLGGRRLMASAIKLREVAFPKLFAQAA